MSRTLLHISDLHFGRVPHGMPEALLAAADQIRPDVVVVSGDLTQRARPHQFRAARRFLDELPAPALVVPGNHDVPLWDVARRLFAPLARYHRLVSTDRWPEYVGDEVAVLGVNTARGLVFKGGRLSRPQMDALCARLASLPRRALKLLVMHHPLVHPQTWPGRESVHASERRLGELQACGVDVLLAGHLHLGWSAAHPVGGSVLLVQAGTATSTRERGEPNSYNLVGLRASHVSVEVRAWDGRGFAPLREEAYQREAGVWRRR